MRTGASAVAWAAIQVNGAAVWHDLCLAFVRSCFNVPPKYGTAADAWAHTTRRHPFTNTPPEGVPVWWAGGQGHVVISAGGGWCYSTDVRRAGHIDRVSIASITANWGLHPSGWSEDINGVRVFSAPVPVVPVVDLSLLHTAAVANSAPGSPTGHVTYPPTIYVERGLNHEGLLASKLVDGSYGSSTVAAYSAWQRRYSALHGLHWSGADVNGLPGLTSLSALGLKYGFRVTP